MAQVVGTSETYPHIGIREDLADIVYNIDPTETPFMTMCGRGTATQPLHEWQTDSLEAANNRNAQIEGDDPTFTILTPTVRLHNQTQISRKEIIISGTLEATDRAGRQSELAYQLGKRSRELKRDMEANVTQNSPVEAGAASGGDARESGGYETWMMTDGNASRGAGGSEADNTVLTDQPDDGAQPTDGTARAFAESDLKSVIQNVWNEGGNPGVIMVGPTNKQNLSAFSGNTTRFDRSEDMRLVTAIDVYVSDFGEHRVVPNRFSRDRSALIIDTEYWSIDYLRGFRQEALAKTGDAEKRQLLVEYTLRASNQKSSGIVADLTTS